MRKRTYYKIKTKDGYFPDFTGMNDLIFDTQYDAEDFVNKNYNLEDFMNGYEIEEFSSDLKEGTSSVYLDMLADYHKALNKAEKLGNVVFTVDLDGEDEEEFDTWRSAVKYAKENGFDRVHVSGFGFEGPYGYDTGDYEEYDAQFLDLNKEPINESLTESSSTNIVYKLINFDEDKVILCVNKNKFVEQLKEALGNKVSIYQMECILKEEYPVINLDYVDYKSCPQGYYDFPNIGRNWKTITLDESNIDSIAKELLDSTMEENEDEDALNAFDVKVNNSSFNDGDCLVIYGIEMKYPKNKEVKFFNGEYNIVLWTTKKEYNWYSKQFDDWGKEEKLLTESNSDTNYPDFLGYINGTLEVIPNEMGINLSNVEKVTWEEQEDGQLKKVEIDFNPGDDLEEDYVSGIGTINTVKECEDKIQELVKKRNNTKDVWWKKELLKDINKLVKLKTKLIANENGQFVTTSKLYSDLYKLAGLEKIQTRTTAIRGYRPITSGSIEIQNDNDGFYNIYFYKNTSKIPEIIEGLKSLGYTVKNYTDSSITVLNYNSNTETELIEDLEEDIEIRPGSTTIVQKYKEFDSKQEAVNFIISEEGYGEMNIRYIPKTKKYRVVWEEIDDNINEDIEKHDTLNQKLFDGEELKPEVKEAIEKIADTFVKELNNDEIRFTLKDIVLLGSNCSYNYTKDSDLDIHLIADSSGLECPDDLYPLLYSAYRSMFNRNYDITIKGIPAELFVEMDEPLARSNGIYSLNNGWIKKPVQQDIPDLDQDAFDKLFNEWEDKYFKLIGEEKLLTEAAQGDKRYYIKPLNIFCSSKNDILNALVKTDKDCIVYTCKNIEDNSRAFTLGTRDIIYYYEDGILYDKNHVKVMDYDLVIKNEENRKKFDVNQAPEQFFDQVYQDRITEDQELNEELDWDDTQDFTSDLYHSIVGVYSNYVDKGVEPKDLEYALSSCLDHFEDDDLYDLTTTVTITDDLDTDRPTSEEVENFIEDLYDLRKQSIANEGEYGLGNLVFKEFRNLGYLDHLKDLRKECMSKELSLEKLK